MELACTIVFVLGWLAMAGYMNYKIWWKPDDIWQVQQEQRRPADGTPGWFRRWMHIDPLGLEKSRGRFIWVERVIAAAVLLLGLLMLAGVLAGLGK